MLQSLNEAGNVARAVPEGSRRSHHVPWERSDALSDERVETRCGKAERAGSGHLYPSRQSDRRRETRISRVSRPLRLEWASPRDLIIFDCLSDEQACVVPWHC